MSKGRGFIVTTFLSLVLRFSLKVQELVQKFYGRCIFAAMSMMLTGRKVLCL
jgi:hypothetical protein